MANTVKPKSGFMRSTSVLERRLLRRLAGGRSIAFNCRDEVAFFATIYMLVRFQAQNEFEFAF